MRQYISKSVMLLFWSVVICCGIYPAVLWAIGQTVFPFQANGSMVNGPDGKPVNDQGIEFWGQSFVAAPNGQIIAKAASDKEEVLIADCDLEEVEFSRTHWPFLRDRRIDAYGDLTKRFVDRVSSKT